MGIFSKIVNAFVNLFKGKGQDRQQPKLQEKYDQESLRRKREELDEITRIVEMNVMRQQRESRDAMRGTLR